MVVFVPVRYAYFGAPRFRVLAASRADGTVVGI